MAEQKEYLRFSVSQRLEHWVLTLSFVALAITGLPQKFAGDGWAEGMIGLMGGIELVRVIHHTAAIIMALEAIYHVIIVLYKVFVLRVRWTMFPRLDDVLDALDVIRYNLGLTKEPPGLPRYSYEEKAEYWAMVWGTLLMGLTGFILWNPINAARFLPGDLIPASKAAHGAEAILAVLAIVVWHFYNVHLKTFNKAVFTGKLSAHQMEREHGLELERIRQGIVDVRPSPQVLRNRERTFIPIAAITTVAMLVMLYLFVGYEQTAITTQPRRAQVQVFAPLTPTPTLRAGATPVPSVSVAKPLPTDHVDRTICNACHETGVVGPKNPVDHAGRTDATCTMCHKPTGATPTPTSAPATKPPDTSAPTTQVATVTPLVTKAPATPAATAAPSTSGVAKPLPASHEGRTTCNACHGTGVAGPKSPADHAERTDATCVACHKPATPGATVAPGATP